MVTDEGKPIAYLSITNTLAWLVGVTAVAVSASWWAPTASARDSFMFGVSAVFFGAVALSFLALSIQAVAGRPGLFIRKGRLIFCVLWSSELTDIQGVRLEKMPWLAMNAIFVGRKDGRYRHFPLFLFRTPAHEILQRIAEVGVPVEGYWPVASQPAKVDDNQTP
jgi:hypothetical protein